MASCPVPMGHGEELDVTFEEALRPVRQVGRFATGLERVGAPIVGGGR